MQGNVRAHCCYCLVAKLCLTVCDPMHCKLPGSSVHGIFQARILEWVIISSSRRSSWSRDRNCISFGSLSHLGSLCHPLITPYTCRQKNFLIIIIVWWCNSVVETTATIIVRDRPIFTSVPNHSTSEITLNPKKEDPSKLILKKNYATATFCIWQMTFMRRTTVTIFHSCELYSDLLGQIFLHFNYPNIKKNKQKKSFHAFNLHFRAANYKEHLHICIDIYIWLHLYIWNMASKSYNPCFSSFCHFIHFRFILFWM